MAKIIIKNVGPPAASEELVRSNLRVKVGDPYRQGTIDDDVRNLYATGFFYNVQVTADDTPDGVILTYKLQGKPRVTEINFQGNTKFTTKKLLKKISSKVGEPLDERKLFTDTQEIQKLYRRKATRTPRCEYRAATGARNAEATGTVTLPGIKEGIKIQDSGGGLRRAQCVLAKETPPRHQDPADARIFCWITGSGVVREDQ